MAEITGSTEITISLPVPLIRDITQWLSGFNFQEVRAILEKINAQIPEHEEPYKPEDELTIKLAIAEVNSIINLLNKAPYFIASNMIGILHQRGMQEIGKLQAESEPAEQPEAE